jgi:hypothetical protein
VRRATLDDPDWTACRFGRALTSLVGSFAMTVLKSVQWFNHILRF